MSEKPVRGDAVAGLTIVWTRVQSEVLDDEAAELAAAAADETAEAATEEAAEAAEEDEGVAQLVSPMTELDAEAA
jgi:hypothetical protein